MKHRRFAVLAPLLLMLVCNPVLGAAATWPTLASSVMSASTSGLSTGVTLSPVVDPDPSYRVGVFYSDYESPNGDLGAGNSATENGAGGFGEVDFESVDFAAYTDITNPYPD
ncbi:MAG: hypothetical protein ACE5I2_09210, partial [Anaerolineae bacterium]